MALETRPIKIPAKVAPVGLALLDLVYCTDDGELTTLATDFMLGKVTAIDAGSVTVLGIMQSAED